MGIWIVINVILFFLLPFYTVIFFRNKYGTKKFIILNLMCFLLLYIICVWKMKMLYSGMMIIFIVTLVYYICTYIIYKDKIEKKIDRDRLISIWNGKSFCFIKNITIVISIVVFIVNIIICERNTINVESISLCLTTLLGMIELIIEFNSKFISEK